MCSSLCLYLQSCSPTGEDDTSDFCRCFVAGHILPDIFSNFVFHVDLGIWIFSRIVLSASLPTLFPGESASCSFWGMVFLLDGSVLILIQPCFLGSQQAVLFGVWRTVLSAFLSNPVSWGASKLFLLGMDFRDFSRTFAEL
jgi:hypothetical protein